MGHNERWRRAGPVALRATLLVAAWVANLRYGGSKRISGSSNGVTRLADFDRVARALQDRVAAVRAQLTFEVGDEGVLRAELEHDIEASLLALNSIVQHEDRPFIRRQMKQMVDSLSGLERIYVRPKQIAA